LLMAQNALDESRATLHLYERSHDKEKTKIHHLAEKLNQEEGRCHLLQERLEQLVLQAESIQEPEVDIKATLDMQLTKHLEVETLLMASREQLSQLRLTLETLEKRSSTHEQELKKIQENIAQLRMEEQALAVRASAVQEFLQEQGVEVHDVLLSIPMGITQGICEESLIDIHEKIKRLGAINLAAIEEYETEQQRKSYLDEQYNDLMQALATLETAIEKMDDETRLRLENTFDAVNTAFKALFPRLFGGGRAQLELTCDNLLEAGIVVMAQPPGKRNSTIHLLSGGEKAMTAVALVFAIFQLNPSPFCMLDEVDAPLDDVNVGRFCDLVKEMSQFVQFLFITHNKVTMELADHLIGVTMREPGVSRLVAVDVKQALAME
jgi:chromosome segregation protein